MAINCFQVSEYLINSAILIPSKYSKRDVSVKQLQKDDFTLIIT